MVLAPCPEGGQLICISKSLLLVMSKYQLGYTGHRLKPGHTKPRVHSVGTELFYNFPERREITRKP